MKRYEVIESRVYRHKVSGQEASIYGAAPWYRHSEAKDWETVHKGWTIKDNKRGTVGVYAGPWKSREEVEAFMAERPALFRQEML